MKEAIFFCIVGLPLFGKEGSGTPVLKILVRALGQYSMVHKFECVYLKIKPNQLSQGALYCKMMQYGFKLSTKHLSETNNNFENSYLKSVISFW